MRSIFYCLPIAILLILLVGAAGCAPQNISKPSSNNASAVLLATAYPCPAFQKCSETGLYFARLSDPSDLKSGKLIPADVQFKGLGFPVPKVRFYALNVEPGVYVPVATRFIQTTSALGISRTHFHTLLVSKEMMERAKIEVKAGQLAFMGRFELTGAMTSVGMGNADEVQKQYETVIREADKAAAVKGGGMLPDNFIFYATTLQAADQVSETVKEHAEAAHKDLESYGWKAQVDGMVAAGASK